MELQIADIAGLESNKLLNKRKERQYEHCFHCEDEFKYGDSKVLFETKAWHQQCFVCAQCLQPLEVDTVFKNDNRMYCVHDFKILFAPSCNKCNNFILEGRIIKAMDFNWHAECFTCTSCNTALADCSKFKKRENNPYCPPCFDKLKSIGFQCHKCKSNIEDNKYLKQDGEFYHPYHFRCKRCQNELDITFRSHDGELYCLRCYDIIVDIPICVSCKRPVESSRVIRALGKTYHSEHFVCSFCHKPFLGSRYFVLNEEILCELHYELLSRDNSSLCSYCQRDTTDKCVEFLHGKKYCVDHFRCFGCDGLLTTDGKIYKFDSKPICKSCLQRLPNHLRKRLSVLHKLEDKMRPKP